MREITLEAIKSNIETATEFVNQQLEELNCPAKALMQVDLAIDEIFSNIANYAYEKKNGEVMIRTEIRDNPLSVILTFIDHGKPYDPLAKEDPDIELSAEERQIGGLGIYLVKKIMDDIAYEYKDGQNILTIRKDIL